MKRILLFTVLIIGFTACKKDNRMASNDGSLNGEWKLNAISGSFSDAPNWQPVSATDSSTLLLKADATYAYTIGSYFTSSGTYSITDSVNSNIKILTLSDTQVLNRFFLKKISATEFKMDYNPGWCGTGYTTRKFEKKD